MASYQSKYTGAEIDNAVSLALTVTGQFDNYLPKSAVGTTVAGLSNGKLDPAYFPTATTSIRGVVSVGYGLTIAPEGKLSVNLSEDYYTISQVDALLTKKADTTAIPTVPTKLSGFTNDIISVTALTTGDDLYRLVIKN